jgi:hypothetical protein
MADLLCVALLCGGAGRLTAFSGGLRQNPVEDFKKFFIVKPEEVSLEQFSVV